MGICQATCGAATSGRGLTGRQVVAAIAATSSAQLRSHRGRLHDAGRDAGRDAERDGADGGAGGTGVERAGAGAERAGARGAGGSSGAGARGAGGAGGERAGAGGAGGSSGAGAGAGGAGAGAERAGAERAGAGGDGEPGSVRLTLAELSARQYEEERVLRVDAANVGGAADVVVHEYAPEIFRYLRQLAGVDEEVFTEEWALPEDRLGLEMSEGRSMAMFLKSKNMKFMCKTIALVEVRVLLEILKKYTEHLSLIPGSLLMRFLMLLRVESGEEVGYILCFSDVFASCSELNEKWDIKGRIPKPGKYQHFPKLIQRPYEPQPYIIDPPRKVLEVPAFLDPYFSDSDPLRTHDKYKLITRKDKSLTRLFWLEKSVRTRLLDVIESDYEFLENAGLMDYSLLIGVTYNKADLSGSSKRIQNMKMTYEMGLSGAVEVRLSDSNKVHSDSDPSKQNKYEGSMDGIMSLYDGEIYYIGVIDMLTHYTWKKKVAHFFKSFLWKSETLSTISPKPYRKRIARYTTIIFPVVDMESR